MVKPPTPACPTANNHLNKASNLPTQSAHHLHKAKLPPSLTPPNKIPTSHTHRNKVSAGNHSTPTTPKKCTPPSTTPPTAKTHPATRILLYRRPLNHRLQTQRIIHRRYIRTTSRILINSLLSSNRHHKHIPRCLARHTPCPPNSITSNLNSHPINLRLCRRRIGRKVLPRCSRVVRIRLLHRSSLVVLGEGTRLMEGFRRRWEGTQGGSIGSVEGGVLSAGYI